MMKIFYTLLLVCANTCLVSAQDQWTLYNTLNSPLPFDAVNAFAIDSSDAVWIGTGYGLARREDNGTWTTYNLSNSGLPGLDVRSLAVAADGSLWVGTFQSGVAHYDGTTWTTYTQTNSGLASNFIKAITIDTAGKVWFASSRGLSQFDGTTWTTYYQVDYPVLRSDNFTSLAFEGNVLWLGTVNGGLVKFTNGVFQIYYIGNSQIIDNTILGLSVDDLGNKWLAHPYGGISVFQSDGSWTRITTSNSPGIISNSYWTIHAINNTEIYGGSQDEGFIANLGSGWRTYTTSNSAIPENAVQALLLDNHGKVWCGTPNHGVAIFDKNGTPNSVETLSPSHTLNLYPNPASSTLTLNVPNETPVQVVDLLGKVWINTPYQQSLDISHLPMGMYLLKTATQSQTFMKR